MNHHIPFIQFRDYIPGLQQQIEEAVLRVVQSKHFILGQEVQRFENEFATFLSREVNVVGTGNGFDALVIALKAVGVGASDEVIIPSNSYMATVNAVLHIGARPVFAEPDVYTYNLTAGAAEAMVTSQTKAILPVHLYGQTCDMAPIKQLAAKHHLKVIEDAAQAHGAQYRGMQAGTLGDAAAFSFYPTKNLGALGDGGAVVSGLPAVADFARKYRNYGQQQKYVGEIVGVNSRLDEMQAAVLRAKLEHLDECNTERQRLASVYLQELRHIGDLILPYTAPGCGHVYHIFNIRTKHRDALQQWLAEHGIETDIHYPVPVHLQPAYRFLQYTKGDFPVAEELAQTSLSIPLYPGLTAQEQERVIAAISKFYRKL
ncbi:DegT/DnrJ/EryC1/StrS family aminotransferase [Pontibacter sp. MBLB2868]|uniref:DegT/DnrJ/EryC1/StrS family aminotransferase n=1 Tax=Pontibacter sp. MBLB2868 TaxID=3451555 RepID=UPI003F7540B0